MKRFKQILAIIAIVILVALYIATLILAIAGNEHTRGWFMACIFATIVVPIIMWVCAWLYNMIKNKAGEHDANNEDQDHEKQ